MANKQLIQAIELAHHEAGHAVAAVALGCKVGRVSLKPDAAGLGEARLARLAMVPEEGAAVIDKRRRVIEREMIIVLAGDAAERERRTIGADSGGEPVSVEFLECANYLARLSGCDDEAWAYAAWLAERAKNVVRSRWPAVEAVAQALLLLEEASGRVVRKLVSEHAPTAWGIPANGPSGATSG